jgi:hypothetical protein
VSELDVIGSPLQTVARHSPAGVTLIAKKNVDGNLVQRFAVNPSWSLTPAVIGERARALVSPSPPSAYVVVQRGAQPATG